jgi:predicted nuclease of restriction endonuclease-like RecB superfamily
LLVGGDGQLCDSKEELAIHNFLVQTIVSAKVIRESQRFVNNRYDEVYIPDWVIYQNDGKFIIEYFGLYGANRYKTYTEKAHRKIEFFQQLKDYEFIPIMPDDFREKDLIGLYLC